jgi:hypothetical protein
MAVTPRHLFALLLALAMALAPLGMPTMAQAAATPVPGHAAMASHGHCDQQPQPDQHHKAADKNCCVAMCIAVVVPGDVAPLRQYHAARERPASDLDRRGFLDEIATPPPKRG